MSTNCANKLGLSASKWRPDATGVVGRGLFFFTYILFVVGLQWSTVVAQEPNPTPAKCQAALDIKAPGRAARDPRPDTPAIMLAERIADRLVMPIDVSLQPMLDSLVAEHGEEMLRRALVMMMSGRARVYESTAVGRYYGWLESDFRYVRAILYDPSRPLLQRSWALSAIAMGIAEGSYREEDSYRDSTATFAVATLLCDMACVVRPFATDNREALSTLVRSARMLYTRREADELRYYSLLVLSGPELPGGRELLAKYSAWEPQPRLRTSAADQLAASERGHR